MTDLTQRLVYLAVVLAFALVLRVVLVFLIKRSVKALLARGPATQAGADPNLGTRTKMAIARASGLSIERQRQRVTTLGSLLRNVVDVVIAVITLLTVLSIIGIPMGPLLASAGVGGVALGFGAQSLVKDYLSGIFMLSEDQFGVGDLITVGDTKGTVLEVSLRVTKLRDPMGTVWYIRNGEILTLGNISQGFSAVLVDIPVAINEDPENVMAVLGRAVAGMQEDPQWADVLMEEPSVVGVDSMSGGTMVMKIALKTGPNQQWGVMREVRQRAQKALAEAGVRGPILYPSTPQ
ncbi:mechanosensitive ion channel family protein [Tessaracoccus antarcticus]|uniref:Mechanosensitive ion channel family protein n=1 Tax=Tessaracoccus antarcticus TaxID=2479848 RepID=A0A3M0G8P3_9ACTN|nr:mechanosensitive ion channel family protein [Tessaracoccus antarcticus]RMB61400.1 mechanosensitive ion channel family protein [Tessaracoccus antarcticus]